MFVDKNNKRHRIFLPNLKRKAFMGTLPPVMKINRSPFCAFLRVPISFVPTISAGKLRVKSAETQRSRRPPNRDVKKDSFVARTIQTIARSLHGAKMEFNFSTVGPLLGVLLLP